MPNWFKSLVSRQSPEAEVREPQPWLDESMNLYVHGQASRSLRLEHDHTFEATDLANEVFLKALRSDAIGHESRTRIRSLVPRLLREVLIDHARAKKRFKRCSRDLWADQVEVDSFADDSGSVEATVELAEVLEELEALDGRARRVVEYRLRGDSVEQASAELGISERTARRDLTLALSFLKQRL